MYKLDHIVHFVDQPEAIIGPMSSEGVHTVLGGKHEMWGTYNSLSYFDDLTYIEFIGIFDEDLFKQSAKEPYTLHETYDKRNRLNGFNRIALRTNTIEEDAKRLESAGFSVYGPSSFSRMRPDGQVVSWKLLHFGLEGQSIDAPFLIEWDRDDQERYDDLVSSGTLSNHPLGKLEVDTITFSVSDVEPVLQWAKVFSFPVEQSANSLTVVLQNCQLVFYTNENGQNSIEEVVIRGARKETVLDIENGKYKFIL